MEMENEEVGSYASFVARMGRASSELRDMEGPRDNFIMEGDERGNNIVNSSMEESDSDVDMFDETTFIVTTKPDPSENADKSTLVIPPEEIQGFLRDTGLNSKPLKKFEVKKENGQFLCPICGHPFNHRGNATGHTYTHMNQAEMQNVNIYHQRCPYSPTKIFFKRRHYADHMNSHEGIKNFRCHICHRGFGGKGGLQCHMLTHVNQGSQEVQTPLPWRHIQCYFCQKKVRNMSSLMAHMCTHTKETPFKCSYCNKCFSHNSTMTSHIRQVHTHPCNPKPFPCPQCPTACNDRGQLSWHIKIVHGEKLHKCPKCSKSFSIKAHLDVHTDSIHNKIRRQCPQCDKTYSNKSHVLRHIKKNHR